MDDPVKEAGETPEEKPRKRRKKRGAASNADPGPAVDPDTPLAGKRAAILVADGFQDEEAVGPAAYLRELGMETVFVGIEAGTVTGKYEREEVAVEVAAAGAEASEYDLLIIPGGGAPETLRLDPAVLDFTRRFFEAGKPVAAICRGPQVLISAGVLPGRTLTCLAGIRDDVRLAGARYRDKPVVTDRNLVTSRVLDDLPAFNQAIVAQFVASASPAEAPEEVAVED